jgi:hypothetical protein
MSIQQLIFLTVAVDIEYTQVLIITEDILQCLCSPPNLNTMGIQPFSGHMVTPVTLGWFTGHTCKITISGVPNYPNYCVIFIVYK